MKKSENWYDYYDNDINIDKYIEACRKEYREAWFSVFGKDEDLYISDYDDYYEDVTYNPILGTVDETYTIIASYDPFEKVL